MRFITCEANGYSITFGLSGFSPFLLAKVDGLYTVENNLKITKNASVHTTEMAILNVTRMLRPSALMLIFS